jgi:hypothetical protein
MTGSLINRDTLRNCTIGQRSCDKTAQAQITQDEYWAIAVGSAVSGLAWAMTKMNPTTTRKRHFGRRLFKEPRYVWLFQCSTRPALRAATLDPRGRNLPKRMCQGGTWTVSGQFIVEACKMSSVTVDIEALTAGIEKDGFFLWNSDTV